MDLTLAPGPATIQVSAASTCDFLQIGIFNPTGERITVVPLNAPGADISFDVKPGRNETMNVPAHEGLQSGFTVDGARFGPWTWKKPRGCESPASAPTVTSSPQATHATGPGHSPASWVFLSGLFLLLIGMISIVVWQTWQWLVNRRRAPKMAARHRAVDQTGVHERVKRRVKSRVQREVVRRWLRRRASVSPADR